MSTRKLRKTFAKLPTEIFHLIPQFTGDFQTLLSLCSVDRGLYRSAAPLAYQFIKLTSGTEVDSFCTSRYLDATYISKLQIGPKYCYNDNQTISVDPQLVQRALAGMKNLKSLYLMVSPEQLTEILKDIVMSFSLDTFVYSGRFSESLLSLLEVQPSITKLGWHGPATESDANLLRTWVAI
ncbi:hypothetical protein B0J17DRAFT_710439 [Rhizoctonia solani]|nr:hypothetical protein B0J17DRAFT_710439 [Rhizoctonia solani]